MNCPPLTTLQNYFQHYNMQTISGAIGYSLQIT